MRLKCWAPGWGLPSIDIDCLSALTYAYFANVPIERVECTPRNTISGTLPELEENDLVYSEPFNIVGIFRREGYNKDYGLSKDENADSLAYLALLEQRLRPAILYTLWIDAENYTKVTRPAYGKASGFPWSLWYPQRIHQWVETYLYQFKGYENMDFGVLDKLVYKEAHNCLNMLDTRLGKNGFFFGDSPSTFDAVLYGYLGVLLHAPLASTELQNHLRGCEHLLRFCTRIEAFFPEDLISSSPFQSSIKKSVTASRKMAVSFGAAFLAMLVYAVTSGVLTTKRSKLAQKLRKYKSDNSMPNYLEIEEFE